MSFPASTRRCYHRHRRKGLRMRLLPPYYSCLRLLFSCYQKLFFLVVAIVLVNALLFMTMTSAMIYLEEYNGALQYDAGMITMTTSDQYYLTINTNSPTSTSDTVTPTITTTNSSSPSVMPTARNNDDGATTGAASTALSNSPQTNIISSPSPSTTTTTSPSTTTTAHPVPITSTETTILSDDVFHKNKNRRVERTMIPTHHHDTVGNVRHSALLRTSIDTTSSPSPITYSSFNTSISPSTTPHSSLFQSSSSTASPSVFESFTHHGNNNDYGEETKDVDNDDDDHYYYFFDDWNILTNHAQNDNFVYYDSRQARFGVDLGPRGNAVYVNIMLPPRWYSEEEEEEEPILGMQETSSFGQGGGDNSSENRNNGTSYSESGYDGSLLNNNVTTTAEDHNDTELWVSINNEGSENTTATTIHASDSIHHTMMEQETIYDIADYFCLEDFIHWRKKAQQSTAPSTTVTESYAPISSNNNVNISTIDVPQPDPTRDWINSTRPITILARRGRCTFESKAQMAMVINEIYSNSGQNNRIDHIIIYNNGTDDDNNPNTPEGLVYMGYERESDEDEITVGLLYIATNSGQDLIRRILQRQFMTSINPHLYVPTLSMNQSAQLNRRLFSYEIDSNKPDWENDTMGDDLFSETGYHDHLISHGWWFPATLTRFCYSCGSEMQFGLASDDDEYVREKPQFNDGSEIYPPRPWEDDYYKDYFAKSFLHIHEFLVAMLVLLLVAPIVVFTVRWYVLGGTFRIVTDENGVRRFRMVSPSIETFVNGTPGTVELNGTKLDRAQVFSLPQIEYGGITEVERSSTSCNNSCRTFEEENIVHDNCVSASSTHNESNFHTTLNGSGATQAMSPFTPSSCCTICIDEFNLGELIRVLPRCRHAFHTECILPWLTERQGCCPVCKAPVLPDELQRTRSPTRRLGSRS